METQSVNLRDEYYKIKHRAEKLARSDLRAFSQYVNMDHSLETFHRRIYEYLQKWVDKEIKKLAIFMPPQHGKSTMSSINTPAFIFGKNPKAKVVCASYNISVSSKFNRACQDIMDKEEYKAIFPKTQLPGKGVNTTNELRNQKYFETVRNKGFYKSVGVNTGLTSDTVEYGIIDDPIKDRREANSSAYRENLWDWYTEVWKTRLNNDSSELLLFTRWHSDDIAGRLFDPSNEHFNQKERDQWTVIVIPAIKEEQEAIEGQIGINDGRDIGDALWESKHSLETHLLDQETSPVKFASLKQQRPSPLKGNVIKKEGFVYMNANEVPFNPSEVPMNFIIDGAFTDSTKNDPSAQIAYRVHDGRLYIYNCIDVRFNMDKYLPFIHGYLNSNDYDLRSKVRIEPKASGLSLISLMRKDENGGFNTDRIRNDLVSLGKYTRAEYSNPSVASNKVVLINGGWIKKFIAQVINFPNDTHDDMLDCLCYAVLTELDVRVGRIQKTSVNLGGSIL